MDYNITVYYYAINRFIAYFVLKSMKKIYYMYYIL